MCCVLVRGGERKDEAEAKSDNIPDINEVANLVSILIVNG